MGLSGRSWPRRRVDESLKKKAGEADEQAVVRFGIPCRVPAGAFNATVSFHWTERTPWARGDDTFTPTRTCAICSTALTDAIARTVADRKLRIGYEGLK